jgi:hypothetical protein
MQFKQVYRTGTPEICRYRTVIINSLCQFYLSDSIVLTGIIQHMTDSVELLFSYNFGSIIRNLKGDLQYRGHSRRLVKLKLRCGT